MPPPWEFQAPLRHGGGLSAIANPNPASPEAGHRTMQFVVARLLRNSHCSLSRELVCSAHAGGGFGYCGNVIRTAAAQRVRKVEYSPERGRNRLRGLATNDGNTASSTRLQNGLKSTIVGSVCSLPRGGITAAHSHRPASWQPCFFRSEAKLFLLWGC